MSEPDRILHYECRLEQFRRMGAVVGKTRIRAAYDWLNDEFIVILKYWPHRGAVLPAGLAFSLPVVGYPSGHMSQHRGLSWSRRSRRGVK